MAALAFYIDAPLQSWGAASKFQHRETNAFPTKSALVGLVAAALGIDKHSESEAEALAPVAALALTVARLEKHGRTGGRLTDFHTVGGGYPDTPEGKQHIPPIAERTKSGSLKWKSPEKRTTVTHRSYLTDASFIAIFNGDASTLEKIHDALLDPVWGVWFGRKTCLPASPLTPTLGADRDEAFQKILEKLPGWAPAPLDQFEYQEETTGSEAVFYQSDQPVSFGQHHGAVPAAYPARGIRQHRPSKKTQVKSD